MKLQPPSQFTVASELLKVYTSSLKFKLSSKADVGRIVNLRCSQLPFCPTSLLMEYMLHGLVRDMDMLGAYFTSVGTAVHTVMQNYLCMSGRFLADYVCHECGTLYHLKRQPICCDRPTEYHEVQIDCLGIQGHIDAIFKDSKGRYWILDFKTTSVLGAPKKQVNPGVAYVEQVESYAYLLYKQYGIRVEGSILFFIPRDNPTRPSVWATRVTPQRFTVIRQRLNGYRKLHRATMEAYSKAEVWSLIKNHKCKGEYCRYCKMPQAELRALFLKAWDRTKDVHPLPVGALEVEAKPEATLVMYHASPYHGKRVVKIGKINSITPEKFPVLGARIQKELATLSSRERGAQRVLKSAQLKRRKENH